MLWLASLLLATAAVWPASLGMSLQVASAIVTPQEITDTTSIPGVHAEADITSGNASETEESFLARLSPLQSIGGSLRAAVAVEPGAPGKFPPRYRGQAPPTTV